MLENNEQEICELFLQLEEKNELFEKLEVNNIKIWHYIRYEIYNLILQILGIFKNPNLDKVYYKKQDTIKDWIDKEILKNQFNIKHKEVFILNHQRRIKQGDYYKCNYTDEWLKKFNRSYYVFELQHADNFHFKPVKTKNLRYIDQVQFMKIFHKKYCTESVCHKESKKVADYLIKILENAFEIVFGVKEKKKIMQIIVHKVTARDGLKDYYGYLLKRIKPKIIIYVVGTGFDQMILGETGRELGIPTVEIQHGHIGRGHLGYNFTVTPASYLSIFLKNPTSIISTFAFTRDLIISLALLNPHFQLLIYPPSLKVQSKSFKSFCAIHVLRFLLFTFFIKYSVNCSIN